MGNIGLTLGMVDIWVEKAPPPADSEAFNKLLDAAKDVTESLRDIRYIIFEDPGLWRKRCERRATKGISRVIRSSPAKPPCIGSRSATDAWA